MHEKNHSKIEKTTSKLKTNLRERERERESGPAIREEERRKWCEWEREWGAYSSFSTSA
jgi:hypothetical protein